MSQLAAQGGAWGCTCGASAMRSLCLIAAVKGCVCATYGFKSWSDPIKNGICSDHGVVPCTDIGGVKHYQFPAGIFEINEQLLIPERTTIMGAKNPNDGSDLTKSPLWDEQTLFLATRGVTDYSMSFCRAKDMVTTRVGFVLSSHATVSNVSYQGIDTIRPSDNGALCGGGAFETKGCAENDCRCGQLNSVCNRVRVRCAAVQLGAACCSERLDATATLWIRPHTAAGTR